MEIARNLIETLKKLCLIFQDANIQFCLIGGLAVSILAKPRATEDIDLLVMIEKKDKERISGILESHFEIIQDYDLMHFTNAKIWRIVLKGVVSDNNDLIIVDLILADNEIYRKSLENTIPLQIDGITIPVVTPENLIQIKKLSNRSKDLEDINILSEYMDK